MIISPLLLIFQSIEDCFFSCILVIFFRVYFSASSHHITVAACRHQISSVPCPTSALRYEVVYCFVPYIFRTAVSTLSVCFLPDFFLSGFLEIPAVVQSSNLITSLQLGHIFGMSFSLHVFVSPQLEHTSLYHPFEQDVVIHLGLCARHNASNT